MRKTLLITSLLFLLLIPGCCEVNEPEGFSHGFIYNKPSSGTTRNIFLAVHSDSNQFQSDTITLEISIGISSEYYAKTDDQFVRIEVIDTSTESTIILYENNVVDSKAYQYELEKLCSNYYEVLYNGTQSVTIPVSFFDNNTGTIEIRLGGYSIQDDESTNLDFYFSMFFNYEKSNEDVTLTFKE